jgi:hypothetical protein
MQAGGKHSKRANIVVGVSYRSISEAKDSIQAAQLDDMAVSGEDAIHLP